MKKPYKELMKDMLTKSFDQRYEEMSKGDKIGHWVFVSVVLLIFIIVFFF